MESGGPALFRKLCLGNSSISQSCRGSVHKVSAFTAAIERSRVQGSGSREPLKAIRHSQQVARLCL